MCLTTGNRLVVAELDCVTAFPSFMDLLKKAGLQHVLPGCKTYKQGVAAYHDLSPNCAKDEKNMALSPYFSKSDVTSERRARLLRRVQLLPAREDRMSEARRNQAAAKQQARAFLNKLRRHQRTRQQSKEERRLRAALRRRPMPKRIRKLLLTTLPVVHHHRRLQDTPHLQAAP